MRDQGQSSNENIEIVDFEPQFAEMFRELSYEWLKEYFTVEPYDRIVLNDPQKEIISRGGFVFFARVGDQMPGTCALLKHTDVKYELAKMGVTRAFRGRGIGRHLALAGIRRATEMKAERLVLATSKLLPYANRLYQSLGFREVSLSEIGPLPYKRETIVMALDL